MFRNGTWIPRCSLDFKVKVCEGFICYQDKVVSVHIDRQVETALAKSHGNRPCSQDLPELP